MSGPGTVPEAPIGLKWYSSARTISYRTDRARCEITAFGSARSRRAPALTLSRARRGASAGILGIHPALPEGTFSKIQQLSPTFASTPIGVGGALGDAARRHRRYYVSIRAPTWGVTLRITAPPASCTSFNPRSHTGSDAARRPGWLPADRFNPRSHMGSDLATVTACVAGVNGALCANPPSTMRRYRHTQDFRCRKFLRISKFRVARTIQL